MRSKLLIFICLLSFSSAGRADKTWIGPTNGGDWAVGANWSGSVAPADGDVVSLMGAVTVRLSSATAWLSDLTLSNATIIVTNWNNHIQSTNITIRSGGRIMLPGPFATNEPSSRISIVCTNLTVLTGGLVFADGQGYRATNGLGAGKGDRGNGGSYGGRGGLGDSYLSAATWITYGNPSSPEDPGSGGGAAVGGAGGGVIRIEASGTADINGTISAAGGGGSANYGSGGSGGSILLQCGTFSGTGLVRTAGGNAIAPGGGGGGGRMAVRYATAPSPWPRLRFSAAPGSGYAASAPYVAQWGTLWMPGIEALTASMTPGIFISVQFIPGASNSLTLGSFQVVSNTFRIATTNFQLTVTGDMTVATNANVGIYNLDVGGSLVLTNAGGLTVYGAATNGAGPDYGSLVGVTNDLLIGPNSTLRLVAEEQTGAAPLLNVGFIRIGERAVVDADYGGFRYGMGPGAGDPGPRMAGAGYGGMGGRGSYGGVKGLPYGSPTGPALSGSGGGGEGSGMVGGYGGGLVRLVTTGTVDVAGTISANGGSVGYSYGSGGSGGGIFIRCGVLTGGTGGLVRANGGVGASNTSGGGGGGRICLDYGSVAPWPGIRLQSRVGSGYPQVFPYQATPGTIYMPDDASLDETLDSYRFLDGRVFLTNRTAWSFNSLTISNCALTFGPSGSVVTVSNSLVIGTNGSLGASVVRCDSLVLTNGGALYLNAASTNGTSPDEAGGLLAVTQDIAIAGASWLYPVSEPLNGGSPRITARHVRITAGGGINANSRGYGGARGLGGGYPGTVRKCGGGHGGKGGLGDQSATNDPYGVVNDSLIAPVWPGSGGSRSDFGGFGGGLIRLEASGTLTLDGTLTAAGGNCAVHNSAYPGGGSGGSILVLCQALGGAATGKMTAPGGNGGASAARGGDGGGGRISVAVGLNEANRALLLSGQTPPSMTLYPAHAGYEGSLSADPGAGYTVAPSYMAQTGTFTFLSAGSFILTIQGEPGTYGQPAPDTYGSIITIPPDSWVTNAIVTPADETNGLRRACLGWTLTLTNGSPVDAGTGSQAIFQFTNDMILTWRWTNEWRFVLTNGPNGTVNDGDYLPWYTNDMALTGIQAVPNGGYVFDRWIGDVPAGMETTNPLTVSMTQARSIEAVFAVSGGTTRTWSGNGRWQDHASWSPAGMPGSADDVILSSGSVSVAEPFQCASLAVNGGADLVFTNWDNRLTVAGAVTVASGGTVRAAAAFADEGPSNRIWLSSGTLTVDDQGLITADALGFSIQQGVTHSVEGGTERGSGGGHGGWGGYGSQLSVSGAGAYDSLEEPVLAGGGGGGDPNGGAGGGAIRLEVAGAATINGTITAKGASASNNSGGGAGGAIWVTCGSLGGATSGLIRASGGNAGSEHGGAGGGGRIAIHGAATSPYGVRLQAGRGSGGFGTTLPEGQMSYVWAARGTVYLTDPGWLTPVLEAGRFEDVSLFVSGMTSWAEGQLSLNQVSLHFGQPGFTVTATNGIVLDGASKLGVWGLATAGDCLITNGSWLCLYAQPSNGPLPAAGALAEIGQALVVGSNSWIMPFSDSTNGGSVRVKAGSLDVAEGGGFDALGRGYRGGYGPGHGYTGNYGGGGGYGGAGGAGGTGAGGLSNGWAAVPERPGSGGGQALPGYGGGLIWIEADGLVRLDGTLQADGGRSWSDGGGGSGGGVLLACRTLILGAPGRIWARGGSSGNPVSGGGGGGGRVAVWLKLTESQREAALVNPGAIAASDRMEITDVYQGVESQISVTNGAGYTNGAVGTVRFLIGHPATGALILLW